MPMRTLSKTLVYNKTAAMTSKSANNQMKFINWSRKEFSLARRSPVVKCIKLVKEEGPGTVLARPNIAQWLVLRHHRVLWCHLYSRSKRPRSIYWINKTNFKWILNCQISKGQFQIKVSSNNIISRSWWCTFKVLKIGKILIFQHLSISLIPKT